MATYYVKTTGDDTTGDGSSGNPWATPGRAGSALGVDDILYIEEGTYTITTSTANVAGGRLSLPANLACTVIGHATGDITDFSARPLISAGSVTGISIISIDGASGQNQVVFNIDVDGEKGAGNMGFDGTDARFYEYVINCTAIDCPSRGFDALSCFGCKSSYTTTRTGVGFNLCNATHCHADHHADGFDNSGSAHTLTNCIASNCTNGWALNTYSNRFFNCVTYNCTNSGFNERSNATLSGSAYVNCIAYGNGGYGYKFNVVAGGGLINCASGSNTSGRTDSNEAFDLNPITLTADPFVDAANGNFELNNTAGGGALLRALGYGIPGQTQALDIGAVQHACTGGGGEFFYGSF